MACSGVHPIWFHAISRTGEYPVNLDGRKVGRVKEQRERERERERMRETKRNKRALSSRERLARSIARCQWHTTATLFNLDRFQPSGAFLASTRIDSDTIAPNATCEKNISVNRVTFFAGKSISSRRGGTRLMREERTRFAFANTSFPL